MLLFLCIVGNFWDYVGMMMVVLDRVGRLRSFLVCYVDIWGFVVFENVNIIYV